MIGETQPGARATFPSGRTETMTAGPGVTLSGEALAEIMRVCLKPTPVEVEIVEVPVWPTESVDSHTTEA